MVKPVAPKKKVTVLPSEQVVVAGSPRSTARQKKMNENRFTIPETTDNANIVMTTVRRQSVAHDTVIEAVRGMRKNKSFDRDADHEVEMLED